MPHPKPQTPNPKHQTAKPPRKPKFKIIGPRKPCPEAIAAMADLLLYEADKRLAAKAEAEAKAGMKTE